MNCFKCRSNSSQLSGESGMKRITTFVTDTVDCGVSKGGGGRWMSPTVKGCADCRYVKLGSNIAGEDSLRRHKLISVGEERLLVQLYYVIARIRER